MPIIEGTSSDPLLNAGTPSNGTDEVQLLTYTATTGTNVEQRRDKRFTEHRPSVVPARSPGSGRQSGLSNEADPSR